MVILHFIVMVDEFILSIEQFLMHFLVSLSKSIGLRLLEHMCKEMFVLQSKHIQALVCDRFILLTDLLAWIHLQEIEIIRKFIIKFILRCHIFCKETVELMQIPKELEVVRNHEDALRWV